MFCASSYRPVPPLFTPKGVSRCFCLGTSASGPIASASGPAAAHCRYIKVPGSRRKLHGFNKGIRGRIRRHIESARSSTRRGGKRRCINGAHAALLSRARNTRIDRDLAERIRRHIYRIRATSLHERHRATAANLGSLNHASAAPSTLPPTASAASGPYRSRITRITTARLPRTAALRRRTVVRDRPYIYRSTSSRHECLTTIGPASTGLTTTTSGTTTTSRSVRHTTTLVVEFH